VELARVRRLLAASHPGRETNAFDFGDESLISQIAK
jgi:hypothetical protein